MADTLRSDGGSPNENQETRFSFGKNWASFLKGLDDDAIDAAVALLRDMLGVDTLTRKTLLDIGSGSGLFSLAARTLGAHVRSFDYDRDSERCTAALRQRFFPDDSQWTVEHGDVRDRSYVTSLGTFDIVYC